MKARMIARKVSEPRDLAVGGSSPADFRPAQSLRHCDRKSEMWVPDRTNSEHFRAHATVLADVQESSTTLSSRPSRAQISPQLVHRRRITRILHGPNVEWIMPGSAEAVSSDTPSIPAPQLEQTVGAAKSNTPPQRASSPTRLSSAIAFGQLKSDSDLEETVERTQPVVVNCVGVLPWATRYCSASFVWEHPRTP